VTVWAHDKEEWHGVHRHNAKHDRFPDEERSLKEMVAKAWDVASDEDFWSLPEEEREDESDEKSD